MKQLIQRKRIEIVAEAVLLGRIRRLIDDLGVTGYTLVPVMGGRGETSEWSRSGQVSTAGEMAMLVCLTSEDKADSVLEAVLPVLTRGRGVLNVVDVAVARGEKF